MKKRKLKLDFAKWHPSRPCLGPPPWGYYTCHCGDHNFPDPFEMACFDKAKEYLKVSSLQEVANWLSAITKRPISKQGFNKRLKNDRSRQQSIRVKDYWRRKRSRAEDIEEALWVERERLKRLKAENGQGQS